MILFLKFRQKAKMLFLDSAHSVDVDSQQQYHIVLSPSLYWIKKATLPVKYLHEVKKIAPTLFEERLPSGNYNYFAYKDGDDFIVFAYEDSKILSLLVEKGIALHQVRSISFAQSSLESLQEPLAINDKSVITKKDGVVILLPRVWFDDVKEINDSVLNSSKYTIRLEQFSHIVDKTTLYKIGALLLLFIFVLLGEYFYYYQNYKRVEREKEAIFQSYKLKPTLMQNRAILESYKKRNLKEQKLRQYITDFLKLNLHKGEKILSIDYDGKKLQVVVEGLKKGDEKRLLASLYKKKIKIKTEYKAEKLLIEVAL
jgi:hypothetical protein